MTDGPLEWNIGDPIHIELFVANPLTNQGVTGLTSSEITLNIERASDSKYWSGSAWASTSTDLTMTEDDNGRYTYTLSASGNTQEDRYIVYARVDYPSVFGLDGAETFEIHRSRYLDVRVYESETA